jgi:itaconyl-CoA hydratase
MAMKEGWEGRYFEDFEVGDVYRHRLGRTVTAADNIWFTFDHAMSAKTAFGKPIVVSTLTLALVTGQSVSDISLNSMTNLGWDDVRLPNPLFEGETVYSQSEVLEKRDSKSRPNVGIVTSRRRVTRKTGKSLSSSSELSWSTGGGRCPRPLAVPRSDPM